VDSYPYSKNHCEHGEGGRNQSPKWSITNEIASAPATKIGRYLANDTNKKTHKDKK